MGTVAEVLACTKDFLGIDLSGEEIELFEKYGRILRSEGQKVNLTSIYDEKEVAVKHFIDSVSCLRAGCFFSGARVIDVGSGAGFPGVPLKIVRPDLNVYLLEAQEKKARFLRLLVSELGLSNVYILNGRAETLGNDAEHREKYDVALARAVAEMAVLAELCLPFVKVGGFFLALKGPGAGEEVKRAHGAIKILGGRVDFTQEYVLPVLGGQRKIIAVKKVGSTPPKYPRRAGIPKKRPL